MAIEWRRLVLDGDHRSTDAWQYPVLDILDAPPGGESAGDRYLVSATPSGDFTGHENDIATYNGSGWDFDTPETWWMVWSTAQTSLYTYVGVPLNTWTVVTDQTLGTTSTPIFAGLTLNGNIGFGLGTNTIAGIQNQNLVDKSAAETISGVWSFEGDSFQYDGAGGFMSISGDIVLNSAGNTIYLSGSDLIFNSSGDDYDVSFRGAADDNLLVLDASKDHIGIGTLGINDAKLAIINDVATNKFAIVASDSATDDTSKTFRMGAYHYDVDEEPIMVMLISSSNTANTMYLGGGSTYGNCATVIKAYIAPDTTTITGTEVVRIDAIGLGLAKGGATNAARLDIVPVYNGFSIIMGSDIDAQSRQDNHAKYVRIGMPHYDNDEEPVTLMTAYAPSGTNDLRIGGGSSAGNAATSITFYTAANSTTTTGTSRGAVNPSGELTGWTGVYAATVGATNKDLYIDNTGKFGYVSSSLRHKENIIDLADYSSKIYDLRPVKFDYIDRTKGTGQFGLIAEEVALVLPELVSYEQVEDGVIDKGEEGRIAKWRTTDRPETVSYSRLIPLLLNEIQKLNARIKKLEERNG